MSRTSQGAPTGAAGRYQALEAARRPFLDRAREGARLTTPGLMPPEGHSGLSGLPTPYQGVGARGVNALASKLLLAQFPPGAPFFRLTVDPASLPAEGDAGVETPDDAADEASLLDNAAAAVERGLIRIEKSVTLEFETGFLRAALHAALRQLIVTGNCLLHLNPDGGARVFRLDRYVVKRDPMGGVREILVKESVSPDALPEEMSLARTVPGEGADRVVDLYTWIRRESDHWSVVQEAQGQTIPGSEGRYPLDRLDWLALRWSHVDGEDYGRGHVEEYLGDLRSLEGLMQAIVEGSAAASRMTVLVAPNGQTDAEELAEAENGAIIDGLGTDVTILQAGKFNDFRIAFEAVKMLTERLSFAFLLGEAAKREATYVTAEEIRFMAAELEDALGGVYSVLSEELQKPLVGLLMHHKAREGSLPSLPPGVLRPEIVTGLDALGRGRELKRLEAFLSFVGEVGKLSATPIGARVDLAKMLSRGGAAMGVDVESYLTEAPTPGGQNALAPLEAVEPKQGADSEPGAGAGAGAGGLDPNQLNDALSQLTARLGALAQQGEAAAPADALNN